MKVASKIKQVNDADFKIADAEDIALEEENVKDALFKIKYKFKNVEELKNSNFNFKTGEVIETLGYYQEGDNGSAIYIITEEEYNDCGLFIQIGKKVAKLIYGEYVNAESIGIRKSDAQIYDNLDKLQKIVTYFDKNNMQLKLKFGQGCFGFSNGVIEKMYNNGLTIEGFNEMPSMYSPTESPNSNEENGTTFFSVGDNADYILNIAPKSPKKTLENIIIRNICFNGGIYDTANQCMYKYSGTVRGHLYLNHVCFSTFDHLFFTGGLNVVNALTWIGYECFFDKFFFRDIGSFGITNSAFNIYGEPNNDNYVVPSCSSINNIQFENICGSWIDYDKIVDVNFNNLYGETSYFKDYSMEVLPKDFKPTNETNIPFFKTSDEYGAINFNNVSMQHIGRFKITKGGESYIFNTLFKNNSDVAFGKGFNANNVALQGVCSNVNILEFNDMTNKGYDSYFSIQNYNFKNILITCDYGYNVNAYFNAPRYVRIKQDVTINTLKEDKTVYDVFNRYLTNNDSIYPNRVHFNKILGENGMVALPGWYSNTNNIEEPYYLFKCKTNIEPDIFNKIDGYLILDKIGNKPQSIFVNINYKDGAHGSSEEIVVDNNKIVIKKFTIPYDNTKTITSITIQQKNDTVLGEQIQVYALYLNATLAS